ncbi:hypothetical protein HYFRA_00005924 [Hymenoscyphus fraxineus]|uniref:Uncharacterized protein n=1 Tax=Hymenoscyphus fraxineus TaxID=746836 RepID=A0A9N9KWV6_9HELO|nr:hypothetical protein HYFRA_00005924 [Hymenoscyphus fraxineus]
MLSLHALVGNDGPHGITACTTTSGLVRPPVQSQEMPACGEVVTKDPGTVVNRDALDGVVVSLSDLPSLPVLNSPPAVTHLLLREPGRFGPQKSCKGFDQGAVNGANRSNHDQCVAAEASIGDPWRSLPSLRIGSISAAFITIFYLLRRRDSPIWIAAASLNMEPRAKGEGG